jgi:hypothetical protein
MTDSGTDSQPGALLIKASWTGTAVFALTATASVFSTTFRPVGVASAMVWFALGCVAFLWAYAIGLERSRTEELAVTTIYFLAGSAPRSVRLSLMGSLAAQLVIAFTAASLRPFTGLAFGILVPMYGLGVAGLWAARHGTFPPRRFPTAADGIDHE